MKNIFLTISLCIYDKMCLGITNYIGTFWCVCVQHLHKDQGWSTYRCYISKNVTFLSSKRPCRTSFLTLMIAENTPCFITSFIICSRRHIYSYGLLPAWQYESQWEVLVIVKCCDCDRSILTLQFVTLVR